MKNRHYLWIVEGKGSGNYWWPCMGFNDSTSGVWLTRTAARKAAKHMASVNSHNMFKKVAFYRAVKYKAEL